MVLDESVDAIVSIENGTMFSMELDKRVVDPAFIDLPELDSGSEGGETWPWYVTDWGEVPLPQQETDSQCQYNVEYEMHHTNRYY